MQGKNIQNLVRQAQKMQEQLENKMDDLQVEASSGGGMVSVTMDGMKRILSVKINPEVIDRDEVEMLQDLLLAAVNQAISEVDEKMKDRLGGFAQGLLSPR